jgi:hypothetical protein
MHKLLSRKHFLALALAFTPTSATADVIDLPDFLSTFLAPDSIAVDEVVVFDQFEFTTTSNLSPSVVWINSSTSDLDPHDRPGKGGISMQIFDNFELSGSDPKFYNLRFRVQTIYPGAWLGGYSIELLGAGATGSGLVRMDGVIEGVTDITTVATANSPAVMTTATFEPRPELIANMFVALGTLGSSDGTAFAGGSSITFVTVPSPETAPIPEPGSAVLLLSGVAAVICSTRRREISKQFLSMVKKTY